MSSPQRRKTSKASPKPKPVDVNRSVEQLHFATTRRVNEIAHKLHVLKEDTYRLEHELSVVRRNLPATASDWSRRRSVAIATEAASRGQKQRKHPVPASNVNPKISASASANKKAVDKFFSPIRPVKTSQEYSGILKVAPKPKRPITSVEKKGRHAPVLRLMSQSFFDKIPRKKRRTNVAEDAHFKSETETGSVIDLTESPPDVSVPQKVPRKPTPVPTVKTESDRKPSPVPTVCAHSDRKPSAAEDSDATPPLPDREDKAQPTDAAIQDGAIALASLAAPVPNVAAPAPTIRESTIADGLEEDPLDPLRAKFYPLWYKQFKEDHGKGPSEDLAEELFKRSEEYYLAGLIRNEQTVEHYSNARQHKEKILSRTLKEHGRQARHTGTHEERTGTQRELKKLHKRIVDKNEVLLTIYPTTVIPLAQYLHPLEFRDQSVIDLRDPLGPVTYAKLPDDSEWKFTGLPKEYLPEEWTIVEKSY